MGYGMLLKSQTLAELTDLLNVPVRNDFSSHLPTFSYNVKATGCVETDVYELAPLFQ